MGKRKTPLDRKLSAKEPSNSCSENKHTPLLVKSNATPDWFPHGWIVEVKPRQSGTGVGKVDKFYVETISGRKFNSLRMVSEYLETSMSDCSTVNKRVSTTKKQKGSSKRQKSTHHPTQESLVPGALPEDGDSNRNNSVLTLSVKENPERESKKDRDIKKTTGRNKSKIAPTTAIRVSKRHAEDNVDNSMEKQSGQLVSNRNSSVLTLPVKEKTKNRKGIRIKKISSRNKNKSTPITARRVSNRRAGALPENGEGSREKPADLVSIKNSSVLTLPVKEKTKQLNRKDSAGKKASSRNKDIAPTTAHRVSKRLAGALPEDVENSKEKQSAEIVSNRNCSRLTLSIKGKTKPKNQKDNPIKKTSSRNKNKNEPTTPLRVSKRYAGLKSNAHSANLESTKESLKADPAAAFSKHKESLQQLDNEQEVKQLSTPKRKKPSSKSSKSKKPSSKRPKSTRLQSHESLVPGALPEDVEDSKIKQSAEPVSDRNSPFSTLSVKEKSDLGNQKDMCYKKTSSKKRNRTMPTTLARVSKRLAGMKPIEKNYNVDLTDDQQEEGKGLSTAKRKKPSSIRPKSTPHLAHKSHVPGVLLENGEDSKEKHTVLTLSVKEKMKPEKQMDKSMKRTSGRNKKKIAPPTSPIRVSKGLAVMKPNEDFAKLGSIKVSPGIENDQEAMGLIENSNAGTQGEASIDELPADSRKSIDDHQEEMVLIRNSDPEIQAVTSIDEFPKDSKVQHLGDEQEGKVLVKDSDEEVQAETSIDEFHKDSKLKHFGDEQEGKGEKSGTGTTAVDSVEFCRESHLQVEDEDGNTLNENSDAETQAEACADEFGSESKQGFNYKRESMSLNENSDALTQAEACVLESSDPITQAELFSNEVFRESKFGLVEFNTESEKGLKDDKEQMVLNENLDVETRTKASVHEFPVDSKVHTENGLEGKCLVQNSDAQTHAEASVHEIPGEFKQHLDDDMQEEKVLVENFDAAKTQSVSSVDAQTHAGDSIPVFREDYKQVEDDQDGMVLIENSDAETQAEDPIVELFLEDSKQQLDDDQERRILIENSDAETQAEDSMDEFLEDSKQQLNDDQEKPTRVDDSIVEYFEDSKEQLEDDQGLVLLEKSGAESDTQQIEDEQVGRTLMDAETDEFDEFYSESNQQLEDDKKDNTFTENFSVKTETEVFVHEFPRDSKQQQQQLEDPQADKTFMDAETDEFDEFYRESNQQLEDELGGDTLIETFSVETQTEVFVQEFSRDSEKQQQQQLEDDAFIENSAVQETEVRVSTFEHHEESNQQDDHEGNTLMKNCDSRTQTEVFVRDFHRDSDQPELEDDGFIRSSPVEESEIGVSMFEPLEESDPQVEDDQGVNTLSENCDSWTRSEVLVHDLDRYSKQQLKDDFFIGNSAVGESEVGVSIFDGLEEYDQKVEDDPDAKTLIKNSDSHARTEFLVRDFDKYSKQREEQLKDGDAFIRDSAMEGDSSFCDPTLDSTCRILFVDDDDVAPPPCHLSSPYTGDVEATGQPAPEGDKQAGK